MAESAKNKPKITNETRIKMSKAQKDRTDNRALSKETKIKIGLKSKGRKYSDEVNKRKATHGNKCKEFLEQPYLKKSEAHKAKISKSLKETFSNPEIRRAISERLSGVPKSEEHKRNLKESLKNRNFTGENNPMYGKGCYKVWIEKYGVEEADRKRTEMVNKREETKRLKRLKEADEHQ